MHESGLVEELIEQLVDVARRNGGGRVARVQVGVGELAGFTREHFEGHFRSASRNSVADGAVLDIQTREGDALTLEAVDIEDA
jgi:hydrogenase nickel incorporation protein HypA/HybF